MLEMLFLNFVAVAVVVAVANVVFDIVDAVTVVVSLAILVRYTVS